MGSIAIQTRIMIKRSLIAPFFSLNLYIVIVISYYGLIETIIEKIMEILTPMDMQHKVKHLAEVSEKLRQELISGVKTLVPKGYTLKVHNEFTCVYHTQESDELVAYDKFLLTIRHNGSTGVFNLHSSPGTKSGISLCPSITANDVYRLNGLIQLLTVDNLSNLSGTTIVREA